MTGLRTTFRRVGAAVACSGILVAISGCAIGNRHSYRDVVATLPTAQGKGVVIATHDQRPYILSGDKQPNFVGIQRGGYGQPFNVSNFHKEPLSTSYSVAACNSIKAAGGNCKVVETTHSEAEASVIQELLRAGSGVPLMFTLREWKTDGLLNTALIYDVTLTALNREGGIAAAKTIRGRDHLDGSFWNGPRHSRKVAPVAFKAKLEEMIGSPEIQAAIGNASFAGRAPSYDMHAQDTPEAVEPKRGGVPATTPAAQTERPVVTKQRLTCSVTQIVEMKKLGLSDAQIERSCQ